MTGRWLKGVAISGEEEDPSSCITMTCIVIPPSKGHLYWGSHWGHHCPSNGGHCEWELEDQGGTGLWILAANHDIFTKIINTYCGNTIMVLQVHDKNLTALIVTFLVNILWIAAQPQKIPVIQNAHR